MSFFNFPVRVMSRLNKIKVVCKLQCRLSAFFIRAVRLRTTRVIVYLKSLSDSNESIFIG